LAGAGEDALQLATRVGPVVTVSQVMPPPGVQLPTGTGVQSSVPASQDRNCDVLWRTWLVLSCSCDVLAVIWLVLPTICAVLIVTWVVLWVI
jgi:hypothetical protein